MASHKFLSSSGNSNINSVLLANQTAPYSSGPLNSFLFSGSSPSFPGSGSRSMFSFEDVSLGKRSERLYFGSFDEEDNGDEEFDDYFHQGEKKKRLKIDQLKFLEKSFEEENKLEPERKIQLAKELGLQPRQVAIWFQNRRARWKTKTLEKDYDVLQASFKTLKADYDNLLNEKDKLKAEVTHLKDKLLFKENENANWDVKTLAESPREEHSAVMVSEDNSVDAKQEDFNSAKSDVFEPDPSDLSQDGVDNLNKNFLSSLTSEFLKNEDSDYYSDHPSNSCYFGFPVDDHDFGFWSY